LTAGIYVSYFEAFWFWTLCRIADCDQRFRASCYVQIQGNEEASRQATSPDDASVYIDVIQSHWRWRLHVTPKAHW